MSTKAKVDHGKITKFLTNMLVLGDTLVVDQNNQIHYRSSVDEPILITSKEGSPAQPLYVYGIDIKDPNALIWNPFVETTTSGTERHWGYNVLSVVLARWVQHIQTDFLTRCVEQKNDSGSIEPSLVPILSKFIDRVDTKMLEEFEHVKKNSNIKEYFNIYFNRLKKKSTLLVGFEDESQDYYKSFPKGKIRKKSWELFLEMIKVILNVDADKSIKETYTCTTTKVEHPQFETFTDVWLNVWKTIIPYLSYFDTIEDNEELLINIEEELPMAKVYRECTMWLAQSSAISPMKAIDTKKMVVPSNTTINTPSSNNNTSNESSTSSWKTMNTAPNYNGYTNPANIVVTRMNSYSSYGNNQNVNANITSGGDKSWKSMGSSNNNLYTGMNFYRY